MKQFDIDRLVQKTYQEMLEKEQDGYKTPDIEKYRVKIFKKFSSKIFKGKVMYPQM